MKPFALLLFFTALAIFNHKGFAQTTGRVLGKVHDSTGTAIINASVTLIADKDTIKIRTGEDGAFNYAKLKGAGVVVIIAAPDYEADTALYSFDKSRQIDVGTVMLRPAYNVLKEVIVKSKPNPVKIMQDTVEFNAAAFRVIEGDNVADLIKQFQGVEVDDSYNMHFMGEDVVKIRVNGKDFFTSNVKDFLAKLPAEIVSKIQIIDDYGDLANFTGIKSGTSRKMLNVVTKPGMDRGDFGSFSVTAGTNKQIGTANELNIWKGEKQTGLGGMYMRQDNGAGQSENGGFSVNHRGKLREKGNFSFNYNTNQGNNDYLNEQAVETVSSIGTYYNNSFNQGKSSNSGHSLYSEFTARGDKTFLNGTVRLGYNQTQTHSNVLNRQSGVVKQDFNNLSNSSNRSPDIHAGFSLSGKTRKGKVLTAHLGFFRTAQYSSQLIRTQTLYYDQQNDQLLKDSLLSRNIEGRDVSKGFDFSTNYTLMLHKDSVKKSSINMMFQYSMALTSAENTSATYVLDAPAVKYGFVDSLSAAFTSVFVKQAIGINYYYNAAKTRVLIGVTARPVILSNHYVYLNQRIHNNNFNYAPNFSYSRVINQGKTLSVSYNGDNNSPSPAQLQPVRNTQNLQNIVIGNPDLKSYFQHNVRADYRYAPVKTGISYFASANASATQNEIVQNVIIIPDTLGSYKQETRMENANGSWNANGNYSVTIPIQQNKHWITYDGNIGLSNRVVFVNNTRYFNKGVDISQTVSGHVNLKKLNLSGKLNYTRSSNNNINGVLSRTGAGMPVMLNPGQFASTSFYTSQRITAEARGRMRLENFGFDADASYTYSANTNADVTNGNRYLTTIALGLKSDVTLKKRFNMSVAASKRINTGYALANTNPFLLGFTVAYQMLKNRNLRLGITGSDLLAQGNLVARQVYGNSIIDSRNNVVTRVFTLGAWYNVSNFGKGGRHIRVDPD